jgi:agmatine deiminase
MSWRMPSETAPHERTWMAFPCEGDALGGTTEATYRAWAAVANAVIEFEPVSMLVDRSELARARALLDPSIELHETAVDECWFRDHGPTFVVDGERLAVVDWIFNGWGDKKWARWEHASTHARFVASLLGVERISSVLVAEGGGFHVDGEGTVLLTDTVQLDPRRNPYADRARVEAEFARTLGTTQAVWVSRGLTRDYDDFGTNGHVDIVATITAPGSLLMHMQNDPEHPDYKVCRELRSELADAVDAAGRPFEITEIPAPATIEDEDGPVDYSYVNHLVVNGGVIACGFGEEAADSRAREILSEVYPGRRVVTVDARPIFAVGGGIHCITQQQPQVG